MHVQWGTARRMHEPAGVSQEGLDDRGGVAVEAGVFWHPRGRSAVNVDLANHASMASTAVLRRAMLSARFDSTTDALFWRSGAGAQTHA